MAAEKLPGWGGSALVVWARDDKVFPLEHGRRLAGLLSADLIEVEDSYSFIPEDRPDRLADAIRGFTS